MYLEARGTDSSPLRLSAYRFRGEVQSPEVVGEALEFPYRNLLCTM